MANLTLRQVKGSALTIAEMDGNFEYFTGSHAITGSLIVTGGITGSVQGVISASYAVTASYVTTSQTASYVLNAVSASYVAAANVNGTVVSASYATTSSYAATASVLLGSVTSASYAATASVLLGSVTSASYAATSSYYDGSTIDASVYFSPNNTNADQSIVFTTVTDAANGGYSYPNWSDDFTFTYNPQTNDLKLTGSLIVRATGEVVIITGLPNTEPSVTGQLWLSGSAGSNSKILCVRG